jgi:RNA polymerase sigma-70 factor (ECF subfamily)
VCVRQRPHRQSPAVPVSADDETGLIARARAGDQAAFGVLTERHSAQVRRVLYRITRDHDAAQDALQEALTRAWLSIGQFEGRSRFSTWLTRIAINQAYDSLRPARPQLLELDDQVGQRVPGWGNQPDAIFESREFLMAIDQALGELPLDYRTAVMLRDVEGLSAAETAEILGIGERALKSRLHRGRMALRAQLDDYFKAGYVK